MSEHGLYSRFNELVKEMKSRLENRGRRTSRPTFDNKKLWAEAAECSSEPLVALEPSNRLAMVQRRYMALLEQFPELPPDDPDVSSYRADPKASSKSKYSSLWKARQTLEGHEPGTATWAYICHKAQEKIALITKEEKQANKAPCELITYFEAISLPQRPLTAIPTPGRSTSSPRKAKKLKIGTVNRTRSPTIFIDGKEMCTIHLNEGYKRITKSTGEALGSADRKLIGQMPDPVELQKFLRYLAEQKYEIPWQYIIDSNNLAANKKDLYWTPRVAQASWSNNL